MARTDANPPMPYFPEEYTLTEIAPEDLSKAVKPKQFLHIDQSECIMCEGCVDICPWKCIHMLSAESITESVDTDQPGVDPERSRHLRGGRGRLHPVRTLRGSLPDRGHHHGQGRRGRPRR